jgi:LemA protein
MKTTFLLIVGLLILGSFAGVRFISVRNQLVTERDAVDAAWSEVEMALNRRADLIPNLLDSMRAFIKSDTPVFQDATAARTAVVTSKSKSDKLAANAQLSAALGKLLLTAEYYPRLRSYRGFLRSQDEIADTENRIAIERRKYNETLQHYNSSIQVFPNNIVAALSGFARDDSYFRTEPQSHTADPSVQYR